ncbi:MAG: hypothetical protein J6S08_04475, partial [Duodenibacillus sp.]|nr:hypothetical protein [Duodenibacillus sp.]
MNKTFKLIFNRVRGCVMVVNELTSACQTGKKAAATAAVVATIMASGGAMAANSPWFDETNESISTSIVELLPNQTTFEANPSTDEHVVLYSLHSATSANDPQTISNQSIHFVVTDNEPSASAPITAHTIKVDGGEVNLTGNAVTIGVENRTQNGSMTSVSSAALSVGQFGQGGTVNVASVETEFNASTDSGSVAGVSVQYGGAMHFTGDKVNINAQSSVDEQPVVYDEWDSHYKVSGLQFDSAQSVTTDANTALNVSVTGTGVTSNAANVFGIEGEHDGGVVNFGGTTNVTTQSNAGNTIGIYLSSAGVDEASDLGSANVVFNGKTTVKTTAQTAEYATGLVVRVPNEALEGIPEEELDGGSKTLRNEVAFNNGLDMTVVNGGKDAVGIVVGNKNDTEGSISQVLRVHGNANVTASGSQRAAGLELVGTSDVVIEDNSTISSTTTGDIGDIPLQKAYGIAHWGDGNLIIGSEGGCLDVYAKSLGDSSLIDLNANTISVSRAAALDLGLGAGVTTIGAEGFKTTLLAESDGGRANGLHVQGGYTTISGDALTVTANATNGLARAVELQWSSQNDLRDSFLTVTAPTTVTAYSTGGFSSEGIRVAGVNTTFTENVSVSVENELGGFVHGVRVRSGGADLTFEKDLDIDVSVGSTKEDLPDSPWGSHAAHGVRLQSVDNEMRVLGNLNIEAQGPEVVLGVNISAGSLTALSDTTIALEQENTFGGFETIGIAYQNSDDFKEVVLGSEDKDGEVVDITVKSLSPSDDAYYNAAGIVLATNSSLVVNTDGLSIDIHSAKSKPAIGIGTKSGLNITNGIVNDNLNATVNAETDITVLAESSAYGLKWEYAQNLTFTENLTINAQTNGAIASYPYQKAYGIQANWGSQLTIGQEDGRLDVFVKSYGDNSAIDLSPNGSEFPHSRASALAVGGSDVCIGDQGFRTNLRAESVGGQAMGIELRAGHTVIGGESLHVEAVATEGIARAIDLRWPDSSDNQAYSLTVNAPTTILAHSTGGFNSEALRVSGIDSVFTENVDMTATTELGGYVNAIRIRHEGADVTFEKDLKVYAEVGSVAEGMPTSEWGGHNASGLRVQSVDKELTVLGDMDVTVKGPENAYGLRAQAGAINALSNTTIHVEQVNALDNASAYGVFAGNATIQIGNANTATEHHWTVDGSAKGNGTAFGLHAAEAADVTIDDAELFITVENGNDAAVGVYVGENAKVNFNNGLLDVTAKDALHIESSFITDNSDIVARGSVTVGQGAKLTIGENRSLTVTNNVASRIEGSINSSMIIGDGQNELAIPYTGEISFQGGELTLSETGRIGANTLKLSGVVVNNYGGAIISESIHLSDGTIWNAFDGSEMQSHTYYFGEGSQYVSTDEDDAGTTFGMNHDQTLYLQGGNFYVKNIASGTKTAYRNVALTEANSALYIENAYDYDNVSVDHDSTRLTVQTDKGQLSVDRLEILKGEMAVLNQGSVTAGYLKNAATLTIDNSNVIADELELNQAVTVANGGVLTTMTDQIFTVGLNAEGSNTDAGALTANGQNITVTGGTLAFNDAFYNLDYATSARDVFNQGDVLVFNGQLYVPSIDPGVPEGSLAYSEVADDANTIMTGVDVYMGLDTVVNDVATVDKSFGSASITVMPTVDSLVVNEEEKLTLVGGGDKELIGFDVDPDQTPTVTVKGDLQVGQLGSVAASGSMSAVVNIAGADASLTVTEGHYAFGDISVTQGLVDIDATGKANFNDVAVHANGQLNVDGTLTVDNLDVKLGSLANANTLIVNNNMTIVSGEIDNATNARLTVGNQFEFTGGTFTNQGELNTDVALIDGTFVDDAIFNNVGTWTTDRLDIIDAQLSNTGTLTLTGDMNVEGLVTNAASKQMTVAGDLTFTGGTFNNEGNLSAKDVTVDAEATTDVMTNAGKLTASNVTLEGGKLSNTGEMDIGDELAVTGGVFENADDLTVGSDLVVDGGVMSNSGVTVVTNALIVGVDSSLTNTNEMSADAVELDGDLINEGALNVATNLTAWGATLENHDRLTADNVVLTDTEFVNAGSVTVADTVVLGAGSTWSQLDGAQLTAQTAYWKDGSQFVTNGTNELAFAGRTDYLQGGLFVHQDATGNQVQITDLAIKDAANTFVEAEYAFENVNVEKNSSLTVRSDDAWLDGETVTVAGNLSVTDGGLVTTTQLSNSGAMTIGNGGSVIADEVNFTGSVTLNTDGLLETYTDQIFTTGLNAYGSNADPHDLTTSGANIVFNGGTLAFNDAYYNLVYAQNAGKLFADGNKLVFNGQLYTGPVTGDNVVHYDDLNDDASLILTLVDALITNKTGHEEFVTGKDFGVSSIILDRGIDRLTIGSDSEVTLIGGANKELVNFADNTNTNLVKVEGKLTVGCEGAKDNSGQLDAKLELNGENARLNVNVGQYDFADIDSFGGHITVAGATMSANDVMLDGGSLTVASAQVTFDNFETSAHVVNDGTMHIDNQLVVDGGTFTNNDTLSVDTTTSIAAGATLTNNQTFTSAVMDVFGSFSNAGTAEVTDLTVDGSVENNGTLTVANKTTVAQGGDITNSQLFVSNTTDVIGSFTNNGTVETGDLTVTGSLENNDTLAVANKTTVAQGGNSTNLENFGSKTVEVFGTFANAGTAAIETDLTVSGTFNNSHTTTVGKNITIAAEGTVTNHLRLTSESMDVAGKYMSVGMTEIEKDLTVEGTIQNDGTLTVANKATVAQGGDITNSQLFVSNTTDVTGSFTNNGTVETGDLTVTGS